MFLKPVRASSISKAFELCWEKTQSNVSAIIRELEYVLYPSYILNGPTGNIFMDIKSVVERTSCGLIKTPIIWPTEIYNVMRNFFIIDMG